MNQHPEKLIRYEDVLEALLLSLNKPEYLTMFPYLMQEHFRALGRTAVMEPESTIRALIEGLAHGTYLELNKKISERRS